MNLAIGIHSNGYGPGGIYQYNCFNPFTYDLYEWYFVVGTYDGSVMKLYVNGTLTAWKSISGNLLYNTNDIYIGDLQFYNNGTLGLLPGNIDEVRIYNRALTEEEIISLYHE